MCKKFGRFALSLGMIVCFGAGCSVTVIPPAHPVDPAVVYLCDYGKHSSLLLPVAPRRWVEYLYGDWNWAALEHTGLLDAIGAIFWSQQATLGVRYIDQQPTQDKPIPPDGPLTQVPVVVNGAACRQVVKELAERWYRQRATKLTPMEPSGGQFWYVKDDQHYSWLHDCNLHTAQLLEQMGCQVKGYAIFSDFDVRKGQ